MLEGCKVGTSTASVPLGGEQKFWKWKSEENDYEVLTQFKVQSRGMGTPKFWWFDCSFSGSAHFERLHAFNRYIPFVFGTVFITTSIVGEQGAIRRLCILGGCCLVKASLLNAIWRYLMS